MTNTDDLTQRAMDGAEYLDQAAWLSGNDSIRGDRLRAIADTLRALVSERGRLECESCGVEIIGAKDDYRCRGCDLHVCDTCMTVFLHFGNELHGTGDPQEAVMAMRNALLPSKVIEADALTPQEEPIDG